MKIDVFYLKVRCTCDQCDSPFCALQPTALIKPNLCVLLYCCACLYHSLMVVQPSWTTVPRPATKLTLLISESFVGTKQSVICVALKTPLKTRLAICVYKTLLLHRVDDYIGFTSSCLPHILQQNCAHASKRCKVRCADESRGARWDGQKTKLSPTDQMLKSIPLAQLPVVDCRQLC